MLVRSFLIIFLTWSVGQVQALTLFDPERQQEKIVEKVENVLPEEKVISLKPQKFFTLVGISQFGENYSATIQAPDGRILRIKWDQGKIANLPADYSDHAVIYVDARRIDIAHPSDSLCSVSMPEKGIVCDQDGKVAHISLNHEPKAKAENSQGEVKTGQVQPPVNNSAASPPAINSIADGFKMALSQQKRQGLPPPPVENRTDAFNSLTKPVAEDEIPPGMTVIRTPFGNIIRPKETP